MKNCEKLWKIVKNWQFKKKIRWSRIWKILSWPDGGSAKDGLLAEVGLILSHHNCILSLVIDECRREKWGFKVSAFIQDFSWHKWRWDQRCEDRPITWRFREVEGFWARVKKLLEQMGICMVLRYEGWGGSKKSEYSVT